MEELKDPVKRQTKAEPKKEAKTEDASLDIDESDYVPASVNGATKVVVSGGDSEGNAAALAQREIILKEIAAFRERSNKRERNKTWYDDEDYKGNSEGFSGGQNDTGRPARTQDNQDGRQPLRATPTRENIPSGPAANRRRGTRDYHQSVKFKSEADRYDRDEDEDIPDEELEKRRLERKKRDLENSYVEVQSIIAFTDVLERTEVVE
jgi:hypothetical protein